MAYDVDALRAFGTKRVSLETKDGTFTGHIVQDKLGDEPVMVLFACDGDAAPAEELVIAVESIVRLAPV